MGSFAKVMMSGTQMMHGIEEDTEAAISNFQSHGSAAAQRDKDSSMNENFFDECGDFDVIVIGRRERSIAEATVLVRCFSFLFGNNTINEYVPSSGYTVGEACLFPLEM